MKPIHIFFIVVLGVAVAIVVTVFGSASHYVTFDVAKELANTGDEQSIHVVGMLKRDNTKEIVGLEYEPMTTPLVLKFTLIDDKGNEEQVVMYDHPKPAELENSQKVVIVGRYHGEKFIADDILLKCPSKYENKELQELTSLD